MDQEATTVSIRLLTELERYDELWARLWPAIKFAVQEPYFEERLSVLEGILERGVSPDASTAEFLKWRIETVEPSVERLNQTLNWFEEHHLFKPFEEDAIDGMERSLLWGVYVLPWSSCLLLSSEEVVPQG